MRFIKIIIRAVLAAACLLSAVRCSEIQDFRADIIGEWHFSGIDTDVFISFGGDGTYELYQKIGDGRYRGYTGQWKLEKDILSGTYGEGIEWGSAYKVDISSFDTLVLSAVNGSGEKIVYEREDIPSSVRDTAIIVNSAQ